MGAAFAGLFARKGFTATVAASGKGRPAGPRFGPRRAAKWASVPCGEMLVSEESSWRSSFFRGPPVRLIRSVRALRYSPFSSGARAYPAMASDGPPRGGKWLGPGQPMAEAADRQDDGGPDQPVPARAAAARAVEARFSIVEGEIGDGRESDAPPSAASAHAGEVPRGPGRFRMGHAEDQDRPSATACGGLRRDCRRRGLPKRDKHKSPRRKARPDGAQSGPPPGPGRRISRRPVPPRHPKRGRHGPC